MGCFADQTEGQLYLEQDCHHCIHGWDETGCALVVLQFTLRWWGRTGRAVCLWERKGRLKRNSVLPHSFPKLFQRRGKITTLHQLLEFYVTFGCKGGAEC